MVLRGHVGSLEAPADLAGSMGKPTWGLLPHHDSDWRWMHERRDSLWYPSLRLYRQPARGDWNAPMAELGASSAPSGRSIRTLANNSRFQPAVDDPRHGATTAGP
jgi:hypothetical protein